MRVTLIVHGEKLNEDTLMFIYISCTFFTVLKAMDPGSTLTRLLNLGLSGHQFPDPCHRNELRKLSRVNHVEILGL
jgi:hypothetical protein